MLELTASNRIFNGESRRVRLSFYFLIHDNIDSDWYPYFLGQRSISIPEQKLNKWNWLFAKKTFSRSQKAWWGGMVEVLFATSLLLAGVILIVVNLTFAFLFSTTDQFYTSIWSFSLQIILGLAMIVVGSLRAIATLWKVGASVERRGAIANRAGEIELFNEVRKRREDLPTVPAPSSTTSTWTNTPVSTSRLEEKYLGIRHRHWSRHLVIYRSYDRGNYGIRVIENR